MLVGIDLTAEFPTLARVFDHVTAVPEAAAVLEDAGGKVQPVFFDARKMASYASDR